MSRFTLRRLLQSCSDRVVAALLSRWVGAAAEAGGRIRLLGQLSIAMADEALVQRRLKELPEKLAALVEALLRRPDYSSTLGELLADATLAFRSRYEIHASLGALEREGFVFPVDRNGDAAAVHAADGNGTALDPRFAMPDGLASCILDLRRRQRRELRGVLSLKGFLEERLDAGQGERATDYSGKIYKLYLMESSLQNRIRSLPDGVRRAFERAVYSFGGIMPVAELETVAEEAGVDVDGDLVKKCLEDAMLGTVAPLRLERFGIEPIAAAVIVFYEVASSCFAARSAPDAAAIGVDEVLSAGVDLATNLGRFLRAVDASTVQFTVEGELYKASARRIAKGLLPIPGNFLPPETQMRFLYAFCRSRRLVERSGERALRLSERGQTFEQVELRDRLRALLGFAVEERSTQGEHFHQVRLRRILLRLLQRTPQDVWHEASFAPLMARNAYLGKLDELRAEEFFAARFRTGGYVPTESVQQVCLHLMDFVKRRLFPLGLVDLGLRDGRPAAIRLTRLGAELLGQESDEDVGGTRSSIVVNPDFEIILFPGDDEHEVVHTFDRFCRRTKSDHVYHFELDRESVQAALADGMTLAELLQELEDRTRTPLPQNVLYRLDDWADQAGVLVVGDGRLVEARRETLIDRFLAVERLAHSVAERVSPTAVRLRPDVDLEWLRDVARDLGFLLDRQDHGTRARRNGTS